MPVWFERLGIAPVAETIDNLTNLTPCTPRTTRMRTSFRKLPREIRNKIYADLIGSNQVISISEIQTSNEYQAKILQKCHRCGKDKEHSLSNSLARTDDAVGKELLWHRARYNTLVFNDARDMHRFLACAGNDVLQATRSVQIPRLTSLYVSAIVHLLRRNSGTNCRISLPRWASIAKLKESSDTLWSEDLRRDAYYILQRLHDSNFLDVDMETGEQLRRLEMFWFPDPFEQDAGTTRFGNMVFQEELRLQLLGPKEYRERHGVTDVSLMLDRFKLDGAASSH